MVGKLQNNIKIYTIEYLLNKDISDQDLEYLFSNNDSIILSIIFYQFTQFTNIQSLDKFWDEIHKDNWYDKYYYEDKEKFNKFKSIIYNIYKNLYCWNNKRCIDTTNMFLLNYGFKEKTNK